MATFRHRTTPGVYITELDAFPRSVAGVQTAVPAFIGYTEKAEVSSKSVSFTPIKISSFADYEQIFGVGFHEIYNIEEVPPGDDIDFDFSCLRQTHTSPPEWVMTYYRYTRVEPVTTQDVTKQDVTKQDVNKQDVVTTNAELPKFNLYNALRLFYANGGGPCYIVSAGTYADGTIQLASLKTGLDAIREQSGPTMLVVPDAVLLGTSDDFYDLSKYMLAQCSDLQDRVAILDVYGTNEIDQKESEWKLTMDECISDFWEGVGDRFLNYGMAYFPFLVTSLVQASEIDYTNFNINDGPQWTLLQDILDDQADLLYDQAKAETIETNYIDNIPTTTEPRAVSKLNQNLVNAIPLLGQMEKILALKISLMPSSPAMAGVYTYTDGARGVWNAPANVGLTSVVKPNVQLNNDQQGELNVPLNGKAINVIRYFTGRGPVVWGARTLDGNSNDWRYIQVRRTLIYVEQSIEAALRPFVFAANDGKTWVAVTSMVSNFLQGLWSQGGLMGAKADEAFTVSCGLGSTMTSLDILEGYMIVQVTLQMIRPAEFIELTFKQKMQGL
jgi:phage tail sheath protein FI